MRERTVQPETVEHLNRDCRLLLLAICIIIVLAQVGTAVFNGSFAPSSMMEGIALSQTVSATE